METPFTYTVRYTLDKSHFSETFDESVINKPFIYAYGKSIFLILLGFAIVSLTQVSPYIGWFLVAIGVVDACNVYFKKPWWLARQMISEAANTELTLIINEEGVSSQSFAVKNDIAWQEVSRIEQTARGWLLYYGPSRYYISSRCLSDEAEAFIKSKSAQLIPEQPST